MEHYTLKYLHAAITSIEFAETSDAPDAIPLETYNTVKERLRECIDLLNGWKTETPKSPNDRIIELLEKIEKNTAVPLDIKTEVVTKYTMEWTPHLFNRSGLSDTKCNVCGLYKDDPKANHK